MLQQLHWPHPAAAPALPAPPACHLVCCIHGGLVTKHSPCPQDKGQGKGLASCPPRAVTHTRMPQQPQGQRGGALAPATGCSYCCCGRVLHAAACPRQSALLHCLASLPPLSHARSRCQAVQSSNTRTHQRQYNCPKAVPSSDGSSPAASCTAAQAVRARLYCLAVLDEANVLGVLAEALAADVHAVLADQTTLVRADTAPARALAVVLQAGRMGRGGGDDGQWWAREVAGRHTESAMAAVASDRQQRQAAAAANSRQQKQQVRALGCWFHTVSKGMVTG